MIKRRLYLTLSLCIAAASSFAVEPWKGEPYSEKFSISGTTGLAVLDGRAGVGLNGNFAGKILHRGFLDDVNDQLYLEGSAGTIFLMGKSAFVYSGHLRWDFHLDEDWTFFAIGGFGGNVASAALGGQAEVYPHFGVGALWHLFAKFSFRGELSHEFSGVGIQVSL